MVLQLAKGVTIPKDIKPAEWRLEDLATKPELRGDYASDVSNGPVSPHLVPFR